MKTICHFELIYHGYRDCMINIKYMENSSWFTRNYGLMLDGTHPTEGWGIFKVNDHLEVQKIDEEDKLKSDDEALVLAKKKGIKFKNPNNIYEVTR